MQASLGAFGAKVRKWELNGRLNSLAEHVAVDAALSHDTTVDDHDGHAPVVEGVELVVGINVLLFRLDA